MEQLQSERDEASRQLAALRDRNVQSNQNAAELLRLRGMVGALRSQLVSATNVSPPATTRSQTQPSHPAWKLREPRRFEEFQNVGNETPEATAETVLWAAYNNSTNLLDMIHMPADVFRKAQEEGTLEILPRALGAKILVGASAIKGEPGQVWLDGGQETTFTSTGTTWTNTTYAGVVNFHLSGRADPNDPTTERNTDMLFAKIDEVWKLVIPGFSPQIPKK